MRKNRSKKIITLTVLSVVFVASLFISKNIVVRPHTILHNHIPSDASIYFRINNPNLLRRFFFDFLFEADLKQKDYKQIDYRSKVNNIPITGIDISQEVYMFYEKWGDENIVGILFHVSDIDSYSRFAKENDNFITAFDNNIASILIIPESLLEKNLDQFELYAKDLLQPNPDRSNARIAFSEGHKKNLFHLFIKGDQRSLIRNINLELFMDNNEIEISGFGQRNSVQTNPEITSFTYLVPDDDKNYLEINAGKLPDTLNRYLNKVLKEIGVDIPDIASQQLLIYAFEIDNIRGSMAVLPKFDGIFRFNEALPNVLEMDSLKSKLLALKNSKLEIGKMTYNVQQLNDYEIYIGMNDLDFTKKEDFPGLLIQGNPGALLNIEGDGIIAQMAKLIPQVQHSKKLFSDMEKFQIESKEYKSDTIQLEGHVIFPKEKTASIEIIKYLLKF